jgi:hypothetical protein
MRGRTWASQTQILPLLVSVSLVALTATAWAGSVVITNGFYNDPSGVYGPRHSLTKVDVEKTGAGDWACEDAINDDGSWAQTVAKCASNTGDYVYHTFCGCHLRQGWNGPRSYRAWMIGLEYY